MLSEDIQLMNALKLFIDLLFFLYCFPRHTILLNSNVVFCQDAQLLYRRLLFYMFCLNVYWQSVRGRKCLENKHSSVVSHHICCISRGYRKCLCAITVSVKTCPMVSQVLVLFLCTVMTKISNISCVQWCQRMLRFWSLWINKTYCLERVWAALWC